MGLSGVCQGGTPHSAARHSASAGWGSQVLSSSSMYTSIAAVPAAAMDVYIAAAVMDAYIAAAPAGRASLCP